MPNDNLAVVGRMSTVYGVRGWLKVNSFTEPKTNIFSYRPWYLKLHGQWQCIDVTDTKSNAQTLLVKFAQCDDRDYARKYVNAEIAVLRSQFAPLAEGEYYWSDLIGLSVYDLNNNYLGQIDSLIETGANDVLVVKGIKEYLIPYIHQQVIVSINLQTKRMDVDWDINF